MDLGREKEDLMKWLKKGRQDAKIMQSKKQQISENMRGLLLTLYAPGKFPGRAKLRLRKKGDGRNEFF